MVFPFFPSFPAKKRLKVTLFRGFKNTLKQAQVSTPKRKNIAKNTFFHKLIKINCQKSTKSSQKGQKRGLFATKK